MSNLKLSISAILKQQPDNANWKLTGNWKIMQKDIKITKSITKSKIYIYIYTTSSFKGVMPLI